ncbi:hypothetical protein GW17_00008701 [Ensete ventricosum]|nr:hypothetical protein GW17_00008701 [Ensete ventricosum]
MRQPGDSEAESSIRLTLSPTCLSCVDAIMHSDRTKSRRQLGLGINHAGVRSPDEASNGSDVFVDTHLSLRPFISVDASSLSRLFHSVRISTDGSLPEPSADRTATFPDGPLQSQPDSCPVEKLHIDRTSADPRLDTPIVRLDLKVT